MPNLFTMNDYKGAHWYYIGEVDKTFSIVTKHKGSVEQMAIALYEAHAQWIVDALNFQSAKFAMGDKQAYRDE